MKFFLKKNSETNILESNNVKLEKLKVSLIYVKILYPFGEQKNNEQVSICLQNLADYIFLNFKVTKNIRDAIQKFQTSAGKNKNNQHEGNSINPEEERKDSKPDRQNQILEKSTTTSVIIKKHK